MEEYLHGIFYTILYVLLCKTFIETFEERRKPSNKVYEYGVTACLIVLDYLVSIVLDRNIVLKEIVIVALGTFFMWLYFKQSCLKISVWVLLYQGLCIVVDYISILGMSRCFPVITTERLHEPLVIMMLGVLSQMLLVCLLMLLRRYAVKKSSEMLTTMEWVRFAVFPLFTIFVLAALLAYFAIPQNQNEKNILIYIAFGLLAMNIIVFYLINDILKREAQIREDRLLLERVKNETGMYRTISENYDKQRKREHEYQNQLTCIAALARDHKVDEINRYLKKYNDEILVHTDLIDTNHVIVNAILNSKYQEARKKGIVFVVKVNDLSEVKLKDEDIVLILSNLLNNAIEASEVCDQAVIRLNFVKEGRQVILSVVNTYSKEPSTDGNKFITTKAEDTDTHGIGISNIKETVEKYGGSCVIKYDKKSFRFAILIPDERADTI